MPLFAPQPLEPQSDRTHRTASAPPRLPVARHALRAVIVAAAILATILDMSAHRSPSSMQASDPAPDLPGSWRSVANGDRVNAMHKDGDTLWVAAEAGGLVRWSLAAGTYVQYLHPQTPLPDNTVYDVAPAVGGGVWAATARGLVRFVPEREQWQVVTPATSPGMPARVVTAVAPLADGTLWVGFAQEWDAGAPHPASKDGSVRGAFLPGGIARFDPAANTWSSASQAEIVTLPGDPLADPRFKSLPSDNVTDLALDSAGTLWVGTRPYYAWDASNCHESDCLGQTDFWVLTGGGLAANKAGAWRRWYPTAETDTACYDRTIWSLAADADERMWVATQGHGVLLMRGFGQAWSCSSGQAYYIKPRGRPDPNVRGLQGNVVRAIAVEAGAGRIWLSQGEGTDVGLGLTVLDPRATFDDSPGSPSWFDSDDVYTSWSVGDPSARNRRASAIVVDDGRPIVGTIDDRNGDGDGVWLAERSAEPAAPPAWRALRTADAGLPSNQITALADDPLGQTTWFAMKNRGVARWQRQTDAWTWWRAFREVGRVALVTSAAVKGEATVRVDVPSAVAFEALFPEELDLVRLGDATTVHTVMAFTPEGDGLSGRLTLSPTLNADVAVADAVVRVTRGPAGDRATQITLRNGSEPWMSALRNDALFQMTGTPPSCPDYPDCWLDGGLAGLVDGVWRVYDPHNSPLDYREAVAVEADQDGRIWVADGNLVATGFGLAVLDPTAGTWRKHQVTADFNAGNGVSDLAIDPESGHVWTAHYPVERRVAIGPGQPEQIVVAGGGVARFDGSRWKSWTKKDSASTMGTYGDYGVYNAVTVDRARGRVWAGGWSTLGSVFHWPRGENVHAQLDACPLATCRARDWVGKRWLNDGLVSALGVDPTGRLWVGTHRHGRGVLPPVGGVKLLIGDAWHLVSPDASGIPSGQIAALEVDGPSAWVGTLRHGAAVYAEAVVPSATPTAFLPTAAPTLTPTQTPDPSPTPSPSPDASPTGGGTEPTPTDPAGLTPSPTPTTPLDATPDGPPSATAAATATPSATPPVEATPSPAPTVLGRCPATGCVIHLPSLWRLNRRR